MQLFNRDTRGTALTDPGRQLLSDAQPLLAEATALRRRAQAAARSGERSFTIGFMPGLTVTAEVRAMRHAHPDLDVRVLRRDPLLRDCLAIAQNQRAEAGPRIDVGRPSELRSYAIADTAALGRRHAGAHTTRGLGARYYADLTDRDAARAMGCPVVTLRGHLRRGLAALRTHWTVHRPGHRPEPGHTR